MDGKYEKAKSQTQNKQCDKLVGTQATRNKPKIHTNGAIRNGRKIHGVSDESNYGTNCHPQVGRKNKPQ